MAMEPRPVSFLTQKVTTVQSPALRSLVWLPAALYYSLLLSILASGGHSRLVPTLTPIPDHSNNSTPTWSVSWLSSISFSKQSNSFSLAVTPPNPRKLLYCFDISLSHIVILSFRTLNYTFSEFISREFSVMIRVETGLLSSRLQYQNTSTLP